jgi:cyclopropane fatty-acyl-phospholipid synthase-like methyltransferase
MERPTFEQMYAGQAPWDIGLPQPAMLALHDAGQIQGSVLDVGCGTGDIALYLASKGHETWGVDFVPAAIERAKAKAIERGIDVHLLVEDALNLERLTRQFDNVIDCGLFHTFSDEERGAFVRGLAAVLRPGGLLHLLCFSDEEPGGPGPRRISQQEIHDTFQDGWQVRQIEAARFEVAPHAAEMFSPGGPKAWRVTIERTIAT